MTKQLKTKPKKISVIIAAYNEEPRIGAVLKVVEKHPLLDEVIVVDDGSKDKTTKVVEKYQVKLIKNPKNMGKTLSVKHGISHAKGDLIMLIDADLKGLTSRAIEDLARPVLDGRVDWTLSLRKNSAGFMKFFKMDWISGERLVPKQALLDPLIWSRPDVGYSLETLMNKSLLSTDLKFCSVYLPDLLITKKAEKIGRLEGWKNEIKMLRQIMKVMPIRKVLAQFFKMAYLNYKFNKK